MESCPKCHSGSRVRAEVPADDKPFAGIRFKPDDVVTFSKRTRMQVLACPSCGYLEFFLVTEKDLSEPSGLGTWVFA